MQDIAYGHCQCGCGQKTSIAPRTATARGRFKGKPMRFIRGHCARVVKGGVGYFWSNVDKRSPDGCWEWLGYRTEKGYGMTTLNGSRLKGAHRIAYELVVGPIPEGLTIDHLCRNTGCVNPSHMEPVTNAENTRRACAARRLDALRAA